MSDTTVFQASYFGFEIKGKKLGYFTSCTGLSAEVEVIEHRAIGESGKRSNFKSPGRMSFSEVVFKRGYTTDTEVNSWFDETVDAGGDPKRTDGSIVLYDRKFTELARFNIFNCLPSKLSVSDLSATSTDAVVEELTIKHDRMEWAK